MAHAEKYKRNNIVGLAIHYERRDGCELSNKDIDSEMSHLNYNLVKMIQPLKPEAFISKRLGEVKHMNRKDIVVMVDWVVTIPKNVPKEDEKRFFELTYQFIRDKHGEKNIVAAWVHNDETTPHIHVSFVPVIEEDGIEKLNCKKLLTRTMLKQFHSTLGSYLENNLGYLPEIQNGATINGNRTIKELKNQEDLSLKKSIKNIHQHIHVSNKVIKRTNQIDFKASRLLDKTMTLKKCNKVIDELKHNNKQLKSDTQSLLAVVKVQKKEIHTYREMPLSKRINEKEATINNLCSSIKELEKQVENYEYDYNNLKNTISQSSEKESRLNNDLKLHKAFISLLGLDKIFVGFKRKYINNNYSIDIHSLKEICSKAYTKIGTMLEKTISRIKYLKKKNIPSENIKKHHTKDYHSL